MKCKKCGSKKEIIEYWSGADQFHSPQRVGSDFGCESSSECDGDFFQSKLCKERVKSQRLANHVKRLEEIMQSGWTVYAYRDVFHAQRVGHNVYSIRKTFNQALRDAELALKKENGK